MGGRWTGVRFDYDEVSAGPQTQSKRRLCAAIADSFTGTLVLPVSFVSCPGARRSLGLDITDEDLVRQICENTGLSPGPVASAVRSVPRLMDPVVSVTLGKTIKFDVAVAYAHPDVIMKIVRRWQGICGQTLDVGISTFMAICGSAVVGAHESGRIQLSLACPASRGENVIRPDAMVVAIPRRILEAIFPVREL